MAFPDDELDIIIEAFLGADPTADPGTWPAATDLSSRLLNEPVQIATGRRPGQKTASAGGCSFVLDNDDGALTPLYAPSTYYPDWDLGVPVQVSVGNVGSSPPYSRVCGYAVDITPTVVPMVGGGTTSAVRVTLGGILRRLGQGSVAVSVLRRWYEHSSPAPNAYWSLDGGELTTLGQLTSGSGGAFVSSDWGTKRRVESGTSQLAPWLGTGLHIQGDTTIVLATIPAPAAPTRVTVEGTFVFDPEADVINACWFAVTDQATGDFTGETWFIDLESLANGTKNIVVFGGSVADPLIDFETLAAPTITAAGPHHVRLDLVQSGGNIIWTVYLDGASVGTDTVAGTLGQYRYAQLTYGGGTSGSGAVTFGHVAVYWNVTPPAVADVAWAVQGYAGEEAHVRFLRICAEEGIPAQLTP